MAAQTPHPDSVQPLHLTILLHLQQLLSKVLTIAAQAINNIAFGMLLQPILVVTLESTKRFLTQQISLYLLFVNSQHGRQRAVFKGF